MKEENLRVDSNIETLPRADTNLQIKRQIKSDAMSNLTKTGLSLIQDSADAILSKSGTIITKVRPTPLNHMAKLVDFVTPLSPLKVNI